MEREAQGKCEPERSKPETVETGLETSQETSWGNQPGDLGTRHREQGLWKASTRLGCLLGGGG